MVRSRPVPTRWRTPPRSWPNYSPRRAGPWTPGRFFGDEPHGRVDEALRQGAAPAWIARRHEVPVAGHVRAAEEREAYTEAQEIADAGIDEMFVINRAGLERFGEILEAIG